MTTTHLDISGAFKAQPDGRDNFENYEIGASGQTVNNTGRQLYLDMQRIRDCGASLRNLGVTVARHYEELSPARKQDFMYMSQIGGGLALAIGGAFALASGTVPVLAGSIVLSGALNSTRSGGQYWLRRVRAKDPGSDRETEMVNSSLSALTKTPQALSGVSLPGIAAVSCYGLRVMNKARQIEELPWPENKTGHSPVCDNQSPTKCNDAYLDSYGISRTFNHSAANISRALDRILGADQHGNRRVDQLPGMGMFGRGALHTVEGIGVAVLNPAAGVFIAGAGIIYTSMAGLMRSADCASGTVPPVKGTEKSPTRSHAQSGLHI